MEKKLVIKWYESIDSTNLQAQRELADMPQINEGVVWVADYQTSGRGQRGNSWESGTGLNLLFTVLLRPDFVNVADQFVISQITVLAIVKFLETRGLSPKIKWPNDIYVGDKKICGILIEHTICGANLSASILGIGVNVNQTRFCSDAPNPTSLKLELGCGQDINREEVLSDILQHLFCLYEKLCNSLEGIDKEYHSYLYRLGEFHDFLEISGDEKNRITAKIVGTNKYGCLVLEKTDGIRTEYAFQQIRYIL